MRNNQITYNTEILTRLGNKLREVDYKTTQRIPSMKRPLWKVILEIPRLFHLPKRFGYCFYPSAVPVFLTNRFLKGKPLLTTAYQLFFLNQLVDEPSCLDLLGRELLDLLISEGLILEEHGFRSTVRFVPWRDYLILSDPDEGAARETDFYVYVGGDSIELINFLDKQLQADDTFKRALDLCAGTSIQSYNLLHRCKSVVAAELNPRAVDYAMSTQKINSADHIFMIQSDLWNNVEGSFDIVVSNPPYLPMPEESVSIKTMDAYGGGKNGLEIPLRIIDGLGTHLNKGGYSAVLAASPIIKGIDTLKEELEPLAEKHGLEINLHAWKYTNLKLDMDLQSSTGICYFIYYVIESKKTGNPSVTVKHLSPPVKCLQILTSKLQMLLYSGK